MYFVMSIFEVTTHAPTVFTSSLLRKKVSSSPCFILLRVSPGGHFASLALSKILVFEKSVCTWKQQLSFWCDFLVLETLDVNVKS